MHNILPSEGKIRLPMVKAVTGLSRSTIYKLINEGRFPSQQNYGGRIVVWDVADIRTFLENGKWEVSSHEEV